MTNATEKGFINIFKDINEHVLGGVVKASIYGRRPKGLFSSYFYIHNK